MVVDKSRSVTHKTVVNKTIVNKRSKNKFINTQINFK